MPRKRVTNKHLPERVYWKNGAFRMLTRDGKWITLGRTEREMYIRMAEMADSQPVIAKNTMNALFDEYMREVAPTKAKATYKSNLKEIIHLRVYFGNMHPEDVTAQHVYGYMRMRGKTAKIRANREKALLSHVFTKAVEWGYLNANPCRDVKNFKEKPSERKVEEHELMAVHSVANVMLQAVIEVANITSLRKTDILKIKRADLTLGGIEVDISKTGDKVLYRWTEGLIIAINKVQRLRRDVDSDYLFCAEDGSQYTDGGFNTLWYKARKKAIQLGLLKASFAFKDVRAKVATGIVEAEEEGQLSEDGVIKASRLLSHSSTAITKKHYIRGRRKLDPVK